MYPRRINLLSIAALIFATAALAAPPRPPEARPIQIENGKLQGFLTAVHKVIAYKGIPYAQPPVEELRWRPPMPIGKWKKVFPARDFGPHCIQQGSYPDMVFHDNGPSEDCLSLNVWAPTDANPTNSKKPAGLPVMVWIYGGGFETGGTSENRQDGEFLAHRGVVVVSMNYRLGIFGFFAHPELTAESGNHTSGNYGLLDQASALGWVRRNIAAFGGDPANITIFGQSAGSGSVCAQMASPLMAGLFAKAIGESGSAFNSLPTLQQAERADAAWAERALGSGRLFYLRQLPADEILKDAMSPNAPNFGPIVDGFFLPDTPAHIYADSKQAHIPLLAGWVANEALPNQIPTAQAFTALATREFGADAAQFLALYPASNDAEAVRSANDFLSDHAMGFPTWAWIEAHAKTGGAPIYRYFFALPSPGDRDHPASEGARHSDDIEYVFGTLDLRPGMVVRPEDRALSEQMQQYWTNFARTGDPNAAGLPKWPAYAATSGWQVMHLNAPSQAMPDPYRDRYLFLNSKWTIPAARQ